MNAPYAIQQLLNRTCATAAKLRSLQIRLARMMVERYGALPECQIYADGTDLGIIGLALEDLDLEMSSNGFPVNCVPPGILRYHNHRKVRRVPSAPLPTADRRRPRRQQVHH